MNRKKLGSIAAILLFGAAVSAFTMMATAGILRVGGSGYLTSSVVWDSLGGKQTGGIVFQYNAGTSESLKVGDVVYMKANNAVGKSATLATNNPLVGIVVGGQRLTGNGAATDSSDVGTLVATAGQKVWVVTHGRAWTKTSDSVYFGDQIIPGSAVAGTIKRRTTAIDSLNRIIGRAISTIDSGKKVVVSVNVK